MTLDLILVGVGLAALIAGTYTDIKTREVPDWISYGLIISGIGVRAIYSAVNQDISYLAYGLAGLTILVGLGYMMFYAGQWGGGDSKLLMGIGAVLGIPFSMEKMPLLIIFMVNVVIIGAIYGFLYSAALAFINRKRFLKELKDIIHDKKMMKIRKWSTLGILALLVIAAVFIEDTRIIWSIILLTAFAYLSFYLMIAVKAVEKSSMYRFVMPSELTEGDWIADDCHVDGKKICGPKDLGISKKQIEKLKKAYKKNKISKIKIKEGIPFVPSFLAAFLSSITFGAWFVVFL